MTVREARRRAIEELTKGRIPSPTPELDAGCLLQEIMKKDRTWLFLNPCAELTYAEEGAFLEAVRRRQTGLSIAYITGRKEFFGIDFFVTPDVLIPKPDTEILVERAVELLREMIASEAFGIPKVSDVCTGSGCIAISVLRTLCDDGAIPPERLPFITAADISGRALSVAMRNADAILPERQRNAIRFVQGDLLENAAGRYDLILANPPYIPSHEVRALLSDGRGEPALALDGDAGAEGANASTNDGLSVIRRLVPQAAENLAEGGALLVEAGEYNAEAAAGLFRQNGFSNVMIHRDLAGQLRVVEGWKL